MITLEKAINVLRELILAELETYCLEIVRDEFTIGSNALTREELDEIGGYGWLYDIDEEDLGEMFCDLRGDKRRLFTALMKNGKENINE